MITIEIHGLTPNTEYSFEYINSSRPGSICESTLVEKSNSVGFISFKAPKHSEKMLIKLAGDRIIEDED